MAKVLVSGGFDPVHSGHIQMIREAANHGDVVVLLNSDEWLTRKKGKPFMKFEERFEVMLSIKNVFTVVGMDDSNGTACDGIKKARQMFTGEKMFFANGGDRKFNTTPSHEQSLCKDLGIECLWGIGGDYKKNSSSTILSDWQQQKEQRPWGEFTTHMSGNNYKVKTLTINPGQRLSLQSHENRNEFWVVAEGTALAEVEGETSQLGVGTFLRINAKEKHRVGCVGTVPCTILELQYGDMCVESDIVRYEDDYARN